MRAIILAAGSKEKWGNYLGVPKHLIPIKGEPLLHRTVRLLDERGVEDIVVVSQPEDREAFVPHPALWGQPKEPEGWAQEMQPSRHLWNPYGKTMLLYGDCYFSEALLDTIVNDNAPGWRVYARFNGSDITGKPYGEMFGWVFDTSSHAELDEARNKVNNLYVSGKIWRCLGWEVYRTAVGLKVCEHNREIIHFVDWSDESDDFDEAHDWEIWKALNLDKV